MEDMMNIVDLEDVQEMLNWVLVMRRRLMEEDLLGGNLNDASMIVARELNELANTLEEVEAIGSD